MSVQRRTRSHPGRELALIAGIALVALVIAVRLEAFERIFYWSQQYEDWEVDEFLTVGFILPFAFAVYAWRRWSDYRVALHDTDVLLQEVHHRTKNSLAIAASLIRLSKQSSDDDTSLEEIATRIDAIAEVHRSLQTADHYDRVDLYDYLRAVVDGTLGYIPDLSVEYVMPRELLPTKAALNLGLAINEIATNAAKYGFNDREPAVFRITGAVTDSELVVTAVNSGNPVPAGMTLRTPDSLGLQLVNLLIEQLGGTATLRATPQAEITLRIPREFASRP